MIATTISPMRIIFTSSTWIDGVRSVERLNAIFGKIAGDIGQPQRNVSSPPSLISNNGVSLKPPSTTEKESSSSIAGSSCQ